MRLSSGFLGSAARSGIVWLWPSIGPAQLAQRARMPLSRSLGDGLFELRLSLGPTARRITYRFTSDGRIVLLATFCKQRGNERAEVARARQAAQDCARNDP